MTVNDHTNVYKIRKIWKDKIKT